LRKIKATADIGTDLATSFFPTSVEVAWKAAVQSRQYVKAGSVGPIPYANTWEDFEQLVISVLPHIDPAPILLSAFSNDKLVDSGLTLSQWHTQFNSRLKQLVNLGQVSDAPSNLGILINVYLSTLQGSALAADKTITYNNPAQKPWVSLEELQTYVANQAIQLGFKIESIITAKPPKAQAGTSEVHMADTSSGKRRGGQPTPQPRPAKQRRAEPQWCSLHKWCNHSTDQCRVLANTPSTSAAAQASRPHSPRLPGPPADRSHGKGKQPAARPVTRSQRP
jgi:hypothetical protein